MEAKEEYFLSKRWEEAQFPCLTGHRNYVNIRYVRIHNLHNSTLQTSVSLLIKKAFPQSPILSCNSAIYLIKKYTGLSNRQLMPLFKPLKQSSISQMSRYFRHAIEKNKQIKQTTERLEKKINEFILNEL